MLVPALIYLAINAGGDGVGGWGIPMATDIAMAVGVLSLLGSASRSVAEAVPARARDRRRHRRDRRDRDLLLRSTSTSRRSASRGVLVARCSLPSGSRRPLRAPARRARRPCLWLALHESGVHATLAGVILGLMAPTRPHRQRRPHRRGRRYSISPPSRPPPTPRRSPASPCRSSSGSSTCCTRGRAS